MHLKGCAPGFCYQENVAAPKQVEQAYNILKTEGLSPETSRYLLESNGYRLGDASQLPSLLDDGGEDLLQRDQGLSGEMLELPKIGEEFKENKEGVEKFTYDDILLPRKNQSNELKVNIQLFGTPKYSEMHIKGLESTIKSLNKRIEEHEKKLSNPGSIYPKWASIPEELKQKYMKHWKHEIALFKEQVTAAEKELRKRGVF